MKTIAIRTKRIQPILETGKSAARAKSLFAHDGRDAVLVLLAILDLFLKAAVVLRWQELSLAMLLLLGATSVFLICTNFQCIAHNFLHNPFFVSRGLNRAFGILNSLCIGIPQSLYRLHHLNHHQFGSDQRDPVTHQTRDYSSIYRFGKDGKPEPIWRYAFIGPLRPGLGELISRMAQSRARSQFLLECVAIAAVAAMVLLWQPAFLLWYLPVTYFGQVTAHAENYLEHFRAVPGSRLTDSVSCYGRFYNWIWFNNGYHQEHHFRPQMHWTKLPGQREHMLAESGRRVVRGAHWFNWGRG